MWLCSQLGAREHYAIPRALFRQGSLDHLLTDAWVPPGSPLAAFGLSDRFHPDLGEAPVRAWTSRLLAFELAARLKLGSRPVVFAYSYAARDIFCFAKLRGWKTVLGQIDPGPFEEEIVAAEAEIEASFAPNWRRAPTDYWKSWREECEAADRIIVNSQWSFDGLAGTGIPKEKLSVVPLALEIDVASVSPKAYPKRFTAGRPLRVLFLGQISLRKGIARLLNVARSLQSQPVEFLMVGPIQITIPEDLCSNRKIRWVGPVAQNSVRNYYEQSDVFILPTLSDGFGLTQLEALAHRLPVIASRRCGQVVTDGVNGLLLDEPTTAAIEEALLSCLRNPDQLAQFSENATVGERFSLSCLGTRLCTLPC